MSHPHKAPTDVTDMEPLWTLDELERFTAHEHVIVQMWALQCLLRREATGLERLAPSLLSSEDQAMRHYGMLLLEEAEGDLPRALLRELAQGEDGITAQRALALLATTGDEEAWASLASLGDLAPAALETCARRDPEGTRERLRAWAETAGLDALGENLPWWMDVARPSDVDLTLDAIHALIEREQQEDEEEEGDNNERLSLWDVGADSVLKPVGADDFSRFFRGQDVGAALDGLLGGWAEVLGPLPAPFERGKILRIVRALDTDEEGWEEARREVLTLARGWLDALPRTPTHAWKEALLEGVARRAAATHVDLEILAALAFQMAREASLARATEALPLGSLLTLWETAGPLERPAIERHILSRWTGAPAPSDEELTEAVTALVQRLGEPLRHGAPWLELAERLAPLGLPTLVLRGGFELTPGLVPLLAMDRDVLRQVAEEHLGADSAVSRALLAALQDHPYRWASRLIVERIERLLPLVDAAELWASLGEIGDPDALDAILARWKVGDERGAKAAVVLAAIGGREDRLPEAIWTEVATMERRVASLAGLLFGGGDGPEAPSHQEGPFEIPLRCTECRQTHFYEVPWIALSTELPPDAPDGWSGMTLGRVIRCKGCGARDRYEILPDVYARLFAEVLSMEEDERERTQRVFVQELRLADGTLVTTPTRAIEHLRARAEDAPDSGEAWRRLGNLCLRFEELEEAERALRRAVELDEDEAEAAYSVATILAARNDPEAVHYGLHALTRITKRHLPAELRAEIASSMTELLGSLPASALPPLAITVAWVTAHGISTLHMSSMDLRKIPSWERLGALLASPATLSVTFTDNLPTDESPLLEGLLTSPRELAEVISPASATASRDDAVPRVGEVEHSPDARRARRAASKAQAKARKKKAKRAKKAKQAKRRR